MTRCFTYLTLLIILANSLPSFSQTWSAVTQPTIFQLNSVFALDANNVWAVGNGATIIKYNGTSWSLQNVPISQQRWGVWAASPTNVYAVGTGSGSTNQLLRNTTGTWVEATSGTGWTTGSMRSVWGSSATNVWITGGNGQAINWTGTPGSWSIKKTGLPASFTGHTVWGLDSMNVWTVGATGATATTGAIYKWNTATASWDVSLPSTSGVPNFNSIWGTAANNIWAVGGDGGSNLTGSIYHFNGTSWTDRTPGGGIKTLNGITGSNASNIWAVGNDGIIYKYNGTTWSLQTTLATETDLQKVAVSAANAIWTVGFNNSNTAANTLYFSNQATALPVTWLSFNAKQTQSKVLLSWSTASEQNTQDFEIQHHNGSGSWELIGKVVAAGTSNKPLFYTFSHQNVNEGKNYYRILQKDFDGRSSYSKTISLDVSASEADIVIYNNPVANGLLSLHCNKAVSVELIDNTGRSLLRQQLGVGKKEINLSRFGKGRFILRTNNRSYNILVQ